MTSSWIFNRSRASRFGDIAVLAFLLAQASDGVLTYLGLLTFGPAAEGNPLIGALVGAVGTIPALTGAKLFAALLGIALHLQGVHRLVAVLTALYLGFAVVPWTAILWTQGALTL